jgi:hypothetical protein
MKVGDLVLVEGTPWHPANDKPGILVEKRKPTDLNWWAIFHDGDTFEWPEIKLEVIK